MTARKPLPTSRQADPAAILARAEASGYVNGKHAEDDKKIGQRKYSDKVLEQQECILAVYVVWQWNRTGRNNTVEECRKISLAKGCKLPDLHELKDFWRFYIKQATGRLAARPTPVSIKTSAKRFKAGFNRYTESIMSDETTHEINHWIQDVLPYEEGSEVVNIERPKYNFKHEDLDRSLRALYSRPDLNISHERTRYNFHFIILDFCSSGGRKGHFFKGGRRYKHYKLVMRRTPAGPAFFYSVDQRGVKGNRDAEHKGFGYTRREHHILRYNAPWLLIQFAIADGALDADHLRRVLSGNGDGPIKWLAHAENLPVCPNVDRQGNITTDSMPTHAFDALLKKLFAAEYSFVRASVHMIRREVGKRIDELYTETERSQHLVQSDPTVFGQSYVARVSSCDGFAAFLGEKPNHDAVDYFQGLEQFWQPGMPVRLPAFLRQEVRQAPELLEITERMNCCSGDELERLKRERANALAKLEKVTLLSYRKECFDKLQQDRLLKGCKPETEDPDPLRNLIPERDRLANAMQSNHSLGPEVLLKLSCDIQVILKSLGSVFYRPGEHPVDGKCSYCSFKVEELPKRKRCDHIHRCRKKRTAMELGVLPTRLQFCYFCVEFYTEEEWEKDCKRHMSMQFKRCGSITYRSTLIRPAFCVVCRQSTTLPANERLQSWNRDCEAVSHVEAVHGWTWECIECQFTSVDRQTGMCHLADHHGYTISISRAMELKPKAECATGDIPSLKEESASEIDEFLCIPNNIGITSKSELMSELIEKDESGNTDDPDTAEIDKLMEEFIEFPPSRSPSPSTSLCLSSCPSLSFSDLSVSAQANANGQVSTSWKTPISVSAVQSTSLCAAVTDSPQECLSNRDERRESEDATALIETKPRIKIRLNPTKTSNASDAARPVRIRLKRSAQYKNTYSDAPRKRPKIILKIR